MTFHTISAIHSGTAGWVGTVTDARDKELYRTGRYYSSAQAAFYRRFHVGRKTGREP